MSGVFRLHGHTTQSYIILNMADAAARREARRKRILENSENRLQRITGGITSVREVADTSRISGAREKPEDGIDVLLDKKASPDPPKPGNAIFDKTILEDEDLLTNSLSSDLRQRNAARGEDVSSNLHTVRNERFSSPDERQINNSPRNETNGDTVQDANPHDSSQTSSTQISLLYTLFVSKWAVVILAAVVNVLTVSKLQYLYGKNVLAPFFALMLVRLQLDDSKTGSQGGSMLSAALLLCNMKPELVYNLRWVMRILKKITEEFAVYIFSFVIIYNVSCSYWHDIDITISATIDPGSNKQFQ